MPFAAVLNLPNQLSLFRIVVIPVFLACLLAEQWFGVEDAMTNALLRTVALVLAIVVCITDWLDGEIARRYNLDTNLGKLLDPLADKIFVAAVLIGFVEIGIVPAWAVVIIISREFLVTGLRLVAVEKGRVIAADTLGKHKTGWQLGLIIGGIVILAAGDYLRAWSYPIDPGTFLMFERFVIWVVLTVVLLLTVDSGIGYLWKNRDVLRDSM